MAKDKPAPAGAPAWMVTFADLMSLLVCFFVLIISFSIQDEQKLQVVAGSVRDAFGVRRDWQARALVEIDGRPKVRNVELPPHNNIVVYMPRPDRTPPDDAIEDKEAQDPVDVASEQADREANEEMLASAAEFLEVSDYAGESLHAQIGDPGADGGEGAPGAGGGGEDWRAALERQQIVAAAAAQARADAETAKDQEPTEPKPEDWRAGLAAEQAKAQAEAKEEMFVEEVKMRLAGLAEAKPEIADLIKNLQVERAEQGVRIELIDDVGQPMFPLGSAEIAEVVKPLVKEVASLVAGTDNRLLITGHTDSRPFRGRPGYDNWALSSDRANATRQALIKEGVPETQIAGVLGKGASDPLVRSDTKDPRNRRIGILLLRTGDGGT